MKKIRMMSGFLALSLVFSTVLISFAAQEDEIRQPENTQVAETLKEEPLFSDMQGHWSEAAVNRLAKAGILNGYPDGTFKPGALVTRAEVAKIISLAFELDTPIQVDYPDVQPDDWFAPYIGLADPYMPEYAPYESGRPYTDPYIRNYDSYTSSGEKFLPQQPDLRMFLAETLSVLKAMREGVEITFPAVSGIEDELSEAFIDGHFSERLTDPHGYKPLNYVRMLQYCWLSWKLGIFEGDENHWFGPMEPVTRAALAVTVDRVLSGENPSALEVFPLPKDPVLPEINGTGAIQGTSMKSYQSIQQMCGEAYDIVIADVIRTNENIFYKGHVNIAPSEVTIRESYLGRLKKGDTVCIEETGIRQPEGDLAVDGVPLLGENMRVLLFLTEPSDEVQGTKEGYGILGVYQGKLFIDMFGGIHSGAEYSDQARLSDPLQEQLDLCGTYGDLATLFPVGVNPNKHL